MVKEGDILEAWRSRTEIVKCVHRAVGERAWVRWVGGCPGGVGEASTSEAGAGQAVPPAAFRPQAELSSPFLMAGGGVTGGPAGVPQPKAHRFLHLVFQPNIHPSLLLPQ